jgi:exodeoxyribonuclease VII large subunit
MAPFSLNTRDSFYSLSAISSGIRDAVHDQFGDRPYWIIAEISELNVRKGHCYLSLVEKLPGTAAPVCELKGIIWGSKFEKIAKVFYSETGVELTANTRILFLASVKYDVKWGLSLVIDDIEPKYTAGLIQVERDRTVARLKADGEYFLNRQVQFPLVPQRVAVISAPDSKGFEDFLNKLTRNVFGYRFEVTLFSALLQGDGAASQMTSRLVEIFTNLNDYDIVAIVRGGGGSIDLNCFNDYKLSRAVARFPLPVITGVGHTTNISVVDEVAYADRITPTDAADFIVQKTVEFEQHLDEVLETVTLNYFATAETARTLLSETEALLTTVTRNRLSVARESVGYTATRIGQGVSGTLKLAGAELRHAAQELGFRSSELIKSELVLLNRHRVGRMFQVPDQLIQKQRLELNRKEDATRHLDPMNILKRGFSITRKGGKAVVKAEDLETGDLLISQFYEGTIQSKVGKN